MAATAQTATGPKALWNITRGSNNTYTVTYTDPIDGSFQSSPKFRDQAQAEAWAEQNIIVFSSAYQPQVMANGSIRLTIPGGPGEKTTSMSFRNSNDFVTYLKAYGTQKFTFAAARALRLPTTFLSFTVPIHQWSAKAGAGMEGAGQTSPSNITPATAPGGNQQGTSGASGGLPTNPFTPNTPGAPTATDFDPTKPPPNGLPTTPGDGGIQTTGGGDVPPAAPMNDQQVLDFIRQNYGPYMGAMVSDPEVGPILLKAARDGITSIGLLYGRLSGTKWWTTTTANQRQWQEQVLYDPQSANAMRAQTRLDIINQATTLGVPLTGPQLAKLVEDTLSFGWNKSQTLNSILDQMKMTPGGGGDIAAKQTMFKAQAAKYLLPLSDGSAYDLAIRFERGQLSSEGVNTMFAQQAKARYGYLSDQIDRGITPSDYFKPLSETVAGELERPVEQIDLMDPKWAPLTSIADPKTGAMRAMTDTEARSFARNMPEWQGTSTSQSVMGRGASKLLNMFGGGGLS
jgi:hypothetical protein